MPGFLSSMKQGLGSVFGGFRRVYTNPAEVEGGSVLGLQPYYRLLWAYYEGSAFETVGQWAQYRGQYRLYRQVRTIYNPTRRLCDFYATHIYPGLLSADTTTLDQHTTLAVPLPDSTPPEMRAALDQLWAWSKWQVNKGVLCRYGAVAGSVLVEAVDDVDESRVYLNIVWPSLVAYLDLDPTGVVLAYVIQYQARDDDGIGYEYRKEVDRDEIRFYRDNQAYDYGEGTSYANPYGFVPAVWIKHKDLGGNTGAPAIHGSIGKIDELNSLAAHIHDQVHKVVGAPVVLWSDGQVGSLFTGKAQQKGPATNPYDTTDLDREGVLMFKGPAHGKVESLAGTLPLHEALEHVQSLLTEIEADHPEVTMYRQLRSMSQVTGPAATRLMGDVVANVDEAAANYDDGCARAFGMALAIGGWRLASGAWVERGPQQAVFAPFSLDQFMAGDLVVSILPRPLIAMSEFERLELEQLRNTVKAAVPVSVAANVREALPE